MDLVQLRQLSQEGKDELANRILQKCSPQKIALQLTNNLQTKAAEAVLNGEHKALVIAYIWEESDMGWETGGKEEKGPLVYFSDRNKASELLLEMVKEHIADKNIKFKLGNRNNDWEHRGKKCYSRGCWIEASLTW